MQLNKRIAVVGFPQHVGYCATEFDVQVNFIDMCILPCRVCYLAILSAYMVIFNTPDPPENSVTMLTHVLILPSSKNSLFRFPKGVFYLGFSVVSASDSPHAYFIFRGVTYVGTSLTRWIAKSVEYSLDQLTLCLP